MIKIDKSGITRSECLQGVFGGALPDEFSATYEAKGVINWVFNRFSEDESQRTRWVIDTEFKFSDLMAIMSLFMRGAFPKQTLEDMNRFKAFAENEKDT